MDKNDIWPDDFCCPKCNKSQPYTSVIGIRKYSARRLDLPYFLCGDCRICSYSKLLLRQTISRWRSSIKIRGGSYDRVYQESKKTLEKVLAYYVKTASYRCVYRFKRK